MTQQNTFSPTAMAYDLGRAAPVDWTGRSAQQVLDAVLRAPRVAEPWGKTARYDALTSRQLAWIVLGVDGRPVWETAYRSLGACDTIQQAREAADRALVAAGVLLLDKP